MSKTKTGEQMALEKDLLVSGKYGSRKERSKRQYDRHKEQERLKEELEEYGQQNRIS